jgi:LmbE family N-acetylglucosaminyl deacetylase
MSKSKQTVRQSLPFRSALVVAPHPDDEALGVGGLVARLTRSGRAVHVIFGAVDGFHHYGTVGTTMEQRLGEIDAVAKVLGFTHSILYAGRDLIEKLDTVPQRDLVDAFETALNEKQPDLFVVPHGVDFDQDHVACFRAAFAAARPIPSSLGKHFPSHVLAYEMPKLTWSDQAFHPNFYVNVTDTIDVKLSAIRAYESQRRVPPHIRSLENIEALARLRGSEVGVAYAESYRVLRWVL